MVQLGVASLTAEFVGTFLLILTVGCNVLSQNPHWGGLSIASVLMVCIYALGGTSGANFNPAVSFALQLAGKMDGGVKMTLAYCGIQILAGIIAAFLYSFLFGQTFPIGPTQNFAWWQAMLCELFYTFMLCFVVLNVATSKNQGPNQYFGLAIGFVIVAGAYGAGALSGGCFNPAVAIGIESASMAFGSFVLPPWCLAYTLFEFLGAGMAVGAFKLVRPEERTEEKVQPGTVSYNLQNKLASEAVGTFILVLTVGLNVLVASKAAAFSIAASLMCMIYALGDVSGAHFNPAVSLSIVLSPHGRKTFSFKDFGCYVAAQFTAGIVAAFAYELVHAGDTFPLGPGAGFNWLSVAVAEIMFTFVLCFVVLSVAAGIPGPAQPAPQLAGFIIGSCITVGGLAIGKISGGSLNPAVSMGIATARKVVGGGSFWTGLVYMVFEFIGGALATGVFMATHPTADKGDIQSDAAAVEKEA